MSSPEAPEKPAVATERPSPPADVIWTRALVALLVATTVVKLRVLASTEGSSDCLTWVHFAEVCRANGPFAAYEIMGRPFDHPLLGQLAVTGSTVLGHLLHVSNEPFLVRLPALAGDLLAAAVLGPLLSDRFGVRRARHLVGLYLSSPLVLLAGLYHGNTDLLLFALVLASALALERDRPALAGAILAAATSVKLPALVALAPLGVVALRKGGAVRFSAAFLLGAAVWFVPPLVGSGAPFVHYVLRYRGTVANQPWPPTTNVRDLLGGEAVLWYARRAGPILFVLLSSTAIAARRERAGDALALVLGVALLVMPLFGVQYFVWFAVPVLLLGVRSAVSYHLVGAYHAASVYAFWGGFHPPVLRERRSHSLRHGPRPSRGSAWGSSSLRSRAPSGFDRLQIPIESTRRSGPRSLRPTRRREGERALSATRPRRSANETSLALDVRSEYTLTVARGVVMRSLRAWIWAVLAAYLLVGLGSSLHALHHLLEPTQLALAGFEAEADLECGGCNLPEHHHSDPGSKRCDPTTCPLNTTSGMHVVAPLESQGTLADSPVLNARFLVKLDSFVPRIVPRLQCVPRGPPT